MNLLAGQPGPGLGIKTGDDDQKITVHFQTAAPL